MFGMGTRTPRNKPIPKFKEGDKVVCINNENRSNILEIGKVYEIAGYNDFIGEYTLKDTLNKDSFITSPSFLEFRFEIESVYLFNKSLNKILD
jgi:hypothetical protein